MTAVLEIVLAVFFFFTKSYEYIFCVLLDDYKSSYLLFPTSYLFFPTYRC